ncbi:hypothetical protein R1sor_012685 [Riccia sorocarpa]|uniref:Uncharacterized protein n=1 Tax=Riccia sorocarpa TaxID=122646 RepID=A0ABD3I7U0_9MARC
MGDSPTQSPHSQLERDRCEGEIDQERAQSEDLQWAKTQDLAWLFESTPKTDSEDLIDCFVVELEREEKIQLARAIEFRAKMVRKSSKLGRAFPYPQVKAPELQAVADGLKQLNLTFLLWEWSKMSVFARNQLIENDPPPKKGDLRGNPQLWKDEHWRLVLGEMAGHPGGVTIDSSFNLNQKDRDKIASRFNEPRSRTNGYAVAQIKDPFRRVVVYSVMALFRPHRMTYLSTNQAYFFEIVFTKSKIDWALMFHKYLTDSIQECLKEDAGTHYFGPMLTHFYLGLNCLRPEEKAILPSHYSPEDKSKKDPVYKSPKSKKKVRLEDFEDQPRKGKALRNPDYSSDSTEFDTSNEDEEVQPVQDRGKKPLTVEAEIQGEAGEANEGKTVEVEVISKAEDTKTEDGEPHIATPRPEGSEPRPGGHQKTEDANEGGPSGVQVQTEEPEIGVFLKALKEEFIPLLEYAQKIGPKTLGDDWKQPGRVSRLLRRLNTNVVQLERQKTNFKKEVQTLRLQLQAKPTDTQKTEVHEEVDSGTLAVSQAEERLRSEIQYLKEQLGKERKTSGEHWNKINTMNMLLKRKDEEIRSFSVEVAQAQELARSRESELHQLKQSYQEQEAELAKANELIQQLGKAEEERKKNLTAVERK